MPSLFLEWLQWSVSPYINRFLQPDTIIPDLSNPQSWNRYSYVSNNPIRFNDPTGHAQATDGDGGGKCDLECLETDDVKQDDETEEEQKHWRYAATVKRGIHIGPIRGFDSPDYDDDGYNGLPRVFGPYNYAPNFHISLNVTYDEYAGVTMSDIQVSNQYSGLTVIDFVQIRTGESVRYAHSADSYMVAPGSYASIPESGGLYDGNDQISINIYVSYATNLGHGSARVPQPINITLPTLPDLKHFDQTGELLPMIGIP